jgi:cytochrome c-type biogenesis protein CcmF
VKHVLGTLALWVGWCGAVVGVTLLLSGLVLHDQRRMRAGRRCVFVVLFGALAAAGIMEWALLSDDFRLQYVVDHHARATPTLFTVASLWGALEGSILLWLVILAGYMAYSAWRFRDRADDRLVGWATLTQLVVAAFFFALVMWPANPFKEVAGIVPRDGAGPNALLQNHVLMAFHPPMLYLGYVGMTIPFSFGIAALATGRLGEGWLVATRRATLVAWGFLTAGIVLGSWWSYEVLGWGGYWAWDPVENASLLPWLTATAYLHSVMVQERRGMLRVWNLTLVVATFSLTILGTFLTRSGVLASVHAFNRNGVGPWLLVFLAAVVVGSLILIGLRGDALRSPGRIDSVVSRESAFLGNNLLFTAFAFVVLLGTVFPLVAEALTDDQLSVGEPYFDRMVLPIALCLLFLMAVAPLLPWRTAGGDVLRQRLLGPAVVGALTMVVAVALGGDGVGTLLVLGLGAFALSGIARQLWVAARARARADAVGAPRALTRAVRGNPRLYGGLVVHAGVVVVAVAFAVSHAYADEADLTLTQGQPVRAAGHTFTYLGSETRQTDQRTDLIANVQIDGGDVYSPSLRTYPTMIVPTPSVRTSLHEDVYLKLTGVADGTASITVFVNPLVVWLWIGGGIIAVGTMVALIPVKRGVRRRRPPTPDPGATDPDVEALDPDDDAALAEVGA